MYACPQILMNAFMGICLSMHEYVCFHLNILLQLVALSLFECVCVSVCVVSMGVFPQLYCGAITLIVLSKQFLARWHHRSC